MQGDDKSVLNPICTHGGSRRMLIILWMLKTAALICEYIGMIYVCCVSIVMLLTVCPSTSVTIIR